MKEQTSVNIRTFHPDDLVQVHTLFVSGLMEFASGVEHHVRSYVDDSLQRDLADIPGNYLSHPRGNFWVVVSGGLVAGMVGIQPTEQPEEAELRRMSVSSSVRRQGIGTRLLKTTEDFCREKGYRRICLSSVDILQPALAMYSRFGYTTVKEEPYGGPPQRPITVVYMVKELD